MWNNCTIQIKIFLKYLILFPSKALVQLYKFHKLAKFYSPKVEAAALEKTALPPFVICFLNKSGIPESTHVFDA